MDGSFFISHIVIRAGRESNGMVKNGRGFYREIIAPEGALHLQSAMHLPTPDKTRILSAQHIEGCGFHRR